VADGLAVLTGISRDRISVLYNPVVNDELTNKMKEPVLHPWFQKGHPPLVLSVGRLEAQKDFETLIRAIALVNQRREAYLMILGKGSQSVVLQDLVNKLGIAKVVEMPGYVENPYAYMARANVFVLSSKYEGFPGVLVEAMACGAPVVSTDCPSGPVEILVEGKYGRLVPVGDVAAMAAAIQATLDQPFSKKDSQRRGLEFNIENTCKGYLNILLPMGEAGI
jgi:glycosyltransferase involved in cell wall biosynthesis